MRLEDTQKNWDALGKSDPLYGVLSHDGKMGGRWDEAEFFATGVTEIAGVLRQSRELGFEPRGRALDFGCAVGRLSQALAPHFESVTGVDIAPSMLELAAGFNRHGARVSYVLNDAPDLRRFESASFDFIYTHIVLQHMAPEYALAYIAEFVRVLKPGGLAVFQLPERAQYGILRLGLKKALPKPLLRLYRRLRYGAKAADAPEIEMNGAAESVVLSCVAAAGGKTVRHGGGWYWVTVP